MFEQVLSGNTKAILALLEKSEIIQKAYLAGGTALALQFGHRVSYDLDFFTKKEFDEETLLPEIKKISDFQLENAAWRTILGKFKDVRFSIFYPVREYPVACHGVIPYSTNTGSNTPCEFSNGIYYQYSLLYPAKKFGMINVVDARDIAAMKIAAIASRGSKRDFVDLYFICKETVSLKEVIRLYDKKYKNLSAVSMHIMKSLVYFDDAEADEMPRMLK